MLLSIKLSAHIGVMASTHACIGTSLGTLTGLASKLKLAIIDFHLEEKLYW